MFHFGINKIVYRYFLFNFLDKRILFQQSPYFIVLNINQNNLKIYEIERFLFY